MRPTSFLHSTDFRSARGLRWIAAFLAAVGLLSSAWPAAAGTRFVPNATGDEITDTATGLIWRRCAEGQSWNGFFCAGDLLLLTWDDALSQARTQASQSGLPWHLPNKKELASLVDRGRINPAIDTSVFSYPPSTWTSTSFVGDAPFAWVIEFRQGLLFLDFQSYYNAAWLVRAGQ